jgi:hypothetical protein
MVPLLLESTAVELTPLGLSLPLLLLLWLVAALLDSMPALTAPLLLLDSMGLLMPALLLAPLLLLGALPLLDSAALELTALGMLLLPPAVLLPRDSAPPLLLLMGALLLSLLSATLSLELRSPPLLLTLLRGSTAPELAPLLESTPPLLLSLLLPPLLLWSGPLIGSLTPALSMLLLDSLLFL